jgi:hypothetical protein
VSTIESIDLHVRSYRSALKSTLEVTISSLTNSHLKTNSILHPLASDPQKIDFSALIYCLLRLPPQICRVDKIVIGQTPEIFTAAGFPSVSTWPQVYSVARRRTCHLHPDKKIMAVFAASISDIDDLTNLLIAFQFEWNKFHTLITSHYHTSLQFKKALRTKQIITDLKIDPKDWQDFKIALGSESKFQLNFLYHHSLNLRLQLLAGSWLDYAKTSQRWWKNIATHVADKYHLSRQKIYFISSNTHSFLNLTTGFALSSEKKLIDFASKSYPDLASIWSKIKNHDYFLHPNDFLYYLSKYLITSPSYQRDFLKLQKQLSLISVPSAHYLDVNVQIIPVSSLVKSHYLDPRLKISKAKKIKDSDALIFNIDYPLGFAAYHILSEVLENVAKIKGLYILGKAAVLNSEIGDLQIPRLVFDEHTQNSYIFRNCFNTFFPFTNQQGSILTNQKSATVF